MDNNEEGSGQARTTKTRRGEIEATERNINNINNLNNIYHHYERHSEQQQVTQPPVACKINNRQYMMQGLQCAVAPLTDHQQSSQQRVGQTLTATTNEPQIESNISVDLKAKIRLLQSKLHPPAYSVTSQQQHKYLSANELLSQNGKNTQLTSKSCCPSNRSESSDEQFTPSPADEELDSLSLASSSSSSSSSTSPPTPPPRFSSLQRSLPPQSQATPAPINTSTQQSVPQAQLAANEISHQPQNLNEFLNRQQQQTIPVSGTSFRPIANERHTASNAKIPSESSVAATPTNNLNNLPRPFQRRDVALTSDNESRPLATHASLPVEPPQRQQASYTQNPSRVSCVRNNMITGQQQRPFLARNNPATTILASHSVGAASNLVTATTTSALLPQVTNTSESRVKPQQLQTATNQRPRPFLHQQQHVLNHHHANQLAPTNSNLNPHKTSIKPASASLLAPGSNRQLLQQQQQLMPRTSSLNNNNYSQTTCYKPASKENCNRNKLPPQQQQQQQAFLHHSTTCLTATFKPLPAAPGTNGILCQPSQQHNNQVVQFTPTTHHHHQHQHQQHQHRQYQNDRNNQTLAAFQEAGFGAPNSRTPITKAVQEMINLEQKQHQQQATFVINEPSSRHPIRGCALPPIPASATPFKPCHTRRLPGRPAISNNLGSISSASMSSISSIASSSTSTSNLQQTGAALASPSISMANLTHRIGNGVQQPAVQALTATATTTTTNNNNNNDNSKYTRDSERDRLKSNYCSLSTDGENICGQSSYLRRLKRSLKGCRKQKNVRDKADEELLNNDNFTIVEDGETNHDDDDDDYYEQNQQQEFGNEFIKTRKFGRCQLIKQPRVVNFVVDEDGDHAILAPESYDQLELNYYSPYQEDCEPIIQSSSLACDQETNSLTNSGLGFICYECGASSSATTASVADGQNDLFSDESLELSKMTINGQIIRGWSEKLSSMSDQLFQACQNGDLDEEAGAEVVDEDGEGGSITMWPLVELHENPLNSISEEHNQKLYPTSLKTTCSGVIEKQNCELKALREVDLVNDSEQELAEEKEIEALLERSRLLSLREGQRQNRAAIRMISSDSIQLLVAATQEQRRELKKEQEQEQEQCELKVEDVQQGASELLESNSIKQESSLLMMQQQRQKQEYSEDKVMKETSNKWMQQMVGSEVRVDVGSCVREMRSTLQEEGALKGEQHKGSCLSKNKENNDIKPLQTQANWELYWNGGNSDQCNSNSNIKSMVPQRNMAPSAGSNSETNSHVRSSAQIVSPKEVSSGQESTMATCFVEQTVGKEESMTSLVELKKGIDRNSEEGCFSGLETSSGQQFKENTCLQTRKVSSASPTTQPAEQARCLQQRQVLSENGQSNVNGSFPSSSEQQRSARQAELLQLIRQRQQQLAINSNSSRSSQELPTLQQLQQQIQQQRNSNLPNSPQQQRMQQWTVAAAAMVQQQEREQQREQHNESLRSNATSVPSSAIAATTTATAATTDTETETTLEMELEQARAAQIPTQVLTTARQSHLSQPHLSLDSPIRDLKPQETDHHHQQQQYSISSNISQSKLQEYDAKQRESKNSFHEPYDKQPVKVMSKKVQTQNLLTTALDCGSRMASPNLSPANVGISEKVAPSQQVPIPTPRLNPQQQQHHHERIDNCFQTELSILTSAPTNNTCLPVDLKNSRLRELSSIESSMNSPTSAQSTPSHSILSDSTTLITEAAMNSSELIPKLIERLDRKLIVMKEEQLSLLREIELNETTGQRLFQYMKQHLTVNEYEKISLHANEIEKVTKLILSLKSRLKKVELELKDRNKLTNSVKSKHYSNQSIKSTITTLPIDDHETEKQQQSQLRNKGSSSQEENIITSAVVVGKQTVRGVSDPTSTIGLPKRNHQHHASLQLTSIVTATATETGQTSSPSTAQILSKKDLTQGRLLPGDRIVTSKKDQLKLVTGDSNSSSRYDRHHQLSLTSSSGGCSSGNESRSSRVSSPTRNHQSGMNVGQEDNTNTKTASSTSSDSIFNCADSAIGSTITGHGGSVTNIEQPTVSQSSLTSNSSTTSSTSHTHDQKNLSSNISVSSHSSMSISSSVPNSPQLVSPVNNNDSSSPHHDEDNNHHHHFSNHHHFNQRSSSKTQIDVSSNVSLNNSDSNNNSDSMVHLLNDTDILMAKRNKLESQLEEAHQLEECIVRRNNIIIERILKKYFSEPPTSSGAPRDQLYPGNANLTAATAAADINSLDVQYNETNINQELVGGEIAEFKQYTRLKSLLLKDTHDIADRIDNAELQLNELKQTNHQRIA